jgi:NAD-reducing hydrogenase large subunit
LTTSATGQNNLAMKRPSPRSPGTTSRGLAIPEPLLNRVEAGIRAFDPCLSCYSALPCLTAPG